MIRKRFLSLILVLSLLLCMLPTASATDASSMTDISGHWAEDNIVWAMENNLFYGVSDTEFSPDTTMTRAMFVTVLGRMAAVWPGDYTDWYTGNLFTDVPADAYYAPYVAWAVRCGITFGTSDTTFSPDIPVTREQLATFLVRYASTSNNILTPVGTPVDSFADAWLVSDYAVDSVESMRKTALLVGAIGDDGQCYFRPQNNATRAEACTVFRRLQQSLTPDTSKVVVDPAAIWVSPNSATLAIGESTQLYSTILPYYATNTTVTWVSTNPRIATVSRNGIVTAQSSGSAEIYAYTWNGYCESCTVTVSAPINESLAYDGESYNEKCIRLFGTVVSDPRNYYSSDSEARAHMVTISVQVWDFADSSRTVKVTKTKYLTVHANIAASVQAAFAEIYNGQERFPIYSVGGYRYDPGSEHFSGTAIDINPNENYQCKLDGTPLTGSYWKPGEDPYSIPLDGDVATAFKHYGFTQGAYWRSSRDYMHFSYFAT